MVDSVVHKLHLFSLKHTGRLRSYRLNASLDKTLVDMKTAGCRTDLWFQWERLSKIDPNCLL